MLTITHAETVAAYPGTAGLQSLRTDAWCPMMPAASAS